jgi:DNA polymerase elongation subunit (family B)
VFFTFHFSDLNGTRIVGKKALELTIDLAKEAGALATKYLKAPHDLEYEKTFMPFVLLSKKRYVGMLYEEDPDKCKRKAMGLVLKRRDNAPVVKEVYGGVIDIIMHDQDFDKAIQFTRQMLQDTIDGKIPMDKLVFSKSLRSGYKNPKQIAHKVLADRIGKREPGNKPRPGDRVAFAYIQTKGKKLQGERIETPEYIKEHGLKLDYGFYISNQIMKPIQQIFALIIENVPSFKKKVPAFRSKLRKIKQDFKGDEVKLHKKETDLRNKMVKELIFDEYLMKSRNIAENNRMITEFF